MDIYVLKFKSKTRSDDQVTSQPWHIDSVWAQEEDAQSDMDRQKILCGDSFDFHIDQVDFYKAGTRREY